MKNIAKVADQKFVKVLDYFNSAEGLQAFLKNWKINTSTQFEL